jgi:hypothetical protein
LHKEILFQLPTPRQGQRQSNRRRRLVGRGRALIREDAEIRNAETLKTGIPISDLVFAALLHSFQRLSFSVSQHFL